MGKSIADNLSAFLQEELPGVSLRPPFVNQPAPALRVDLEAEMGAAREDEKVARLVGLYESLFDESARGFLAAFAWPRNGVIADNDYLIGILNQANIVPELTKGVNYYGTEDVDEFIPYTQLTAEVTFRELDYINILKGIVIRELDVSGPIVNWRVFFIGTKPPVVIHPYDDRGVDIVAAQETTLAGLVGREAR